MQSLWYAQREAPSEQRCSNTHFCKATHMQNLELQVVKIKLRFSFFQANNTPAHASLDPTIRSDNKDWDP